MPIPSPNSMGDVAAQLNIKTYADAGSMLPLVSAANQNSHSKRLDIIAESSVGAWANRMASPDPVEAASTQKILTGSDKMDTGLVASMMQMLAKVAQTTPPNTGT